MSIFDVLLKLKLKFLLAVLIGWNAVVGGSYLLWGQRGYAWGGPLGCALLGMVAIWLWSDVKRVKAAYRADCDDDTISHIRGQLLFIASIAILALAAAGVSLVW